MTTDRNSLHSSTSPSVPAAVTPAAAQPCFDPCEGVSPKKKQPRRSPLSWLRASAPKRPSARLFLFTPAEERAMARAILLSVAFMESYGKGRQPYLINRSNYL